MAENKPVSSTPEVYEGRFKTFLIFGAIGVFAAIVFGLIYLFVIAPAAPNSSVGWFLFAFATGITMIIMPCTLPLAFVIVPLSMGKGLVKGLGMALAFGLGVAITQSMYGVLAALLGGLVLSSFGAPLELVKNWVYLIAGIFALAFALGEIGLIKVRMPTYSGAAPAFIQKQQDVMKALFLGLFLGNIGVGCPHPATPLLLIEAASSGNVLYGWLLFLVHATGRILPLLLLAFLGILGVNGLSWLVTKKDAVERATGWAMVFVAGFILTLGLFTHAWWVNSGLHGLLESITQEHFFNTWFNHALNSSVAHVHGTETTPGMFGLPLWLGHWFLVSVWLVPVWIWFLKKKKALYGSPVFKLRALERRIDQLEKERRQIESMVNLDEVEVTLDLKKHQDEMDRLEKVRREEEAKVEFGEKGALQSPIARSYEVRLLSMQRNYLIVISVFTILVFAYFLPANFYLNSLNSAHSHTGMIMATGTPYSTDLVKLKEAHDPETVVLKDGDTYTLTASYVRKEVGNKLLRMMAYNGSVPGPFIHAPQGSTITINFKNETDIDQTIHSHGVRVNNLSDGVPGVTQKVVAPGESYSYKINFADAGVYWFHPHTREDYAQEMGLYGNYLVDPIDPQYWSSVNREIPLIVDDILLDNDKIAPFYKEYSDHALLGRFGNSFMVNGVQDYTLSIDKGEVVRFFVTNVSNARPYNLSIPGVQMKIVGGDSGKMEREVNADSFILTPAERVVVEAYFEKPGAYQLINTTPDGQNTLATFSVDSNSSTTDDYSKDFATLRTDAADAELFATARTYLTQEPQKRVTMTVTLMGNVSHAGHTHATAGATPTASTTSTTILSSGPLAGIQWNDIGNTDTTNTTSNIFWKLLDNDTGKVNSDIHWVFKQGSLVKMRFTNDGTAAHVMMHPIHFHGQRFLVLAVNGVPNDNLVWKDTTMVRPNESVDLLVDMSNPGEWMAHCHVAEHLHTGMALNFRVEDQNGNATGDEFRATLPKSAGTGSMGDMMKTMGTGTMGGMMQASNALQNVYLGIPPANLTFNSTVPPNNYKVIPERIFAQIGKTENLLMEILDTSATPIQLSKDVPHPITITYVRTDDKVKVLTFPGNTVFTPILDTSGTAAAAGVQPTTPPVAPAPPAVPAGMMRMQDGTMMQMQPPKPSSFLPLINVAYAHGGAADGHPSATLATYSYNVPVVFPATGTYRAFVQFVPLGGTEVRMATYDLEVSGAGWSIDNYGWSAPKKRWILAIISLLIMAPLSLFVRRYIGKE